MMRIKYLTIHMSMDRALVGGLHLAEKIMALKELVGYAQRNDVVIGLENVTGDPVDLEHEHEGRATIPQICYAVSKLLDRVGDLSSGGGCHAD
jgi:hypothetical protein